MCINVGWQTCQVLYKNAHGVNADTSISSGSPVRQADSAHVNCFTSKMSKEMPSNLQSTSDCCNNFNVHSAEIARTPIRRATTVHEGHLHFENVIFCIAVVPCSLLKILLSWDSLIGSCCHQSWTVQCCSYTSMACKLLYSQTVR